ncbi:MAG TPA: hypothetical protein VFJ02_09635 [Vicinamibacterales bacterium]|nr:hypothetical protein [Vicinamibacterales bacterium]
MKKGIVIGVSGVVVAAALAALVPAAYAQARDPEAQRRRNQIRLMEGVLVQAVRLGAEQVSKELERFEPTGVTVLMGTPRARGFVLDGHGVFFDVEVPDMNQSVVWSVMQAQRDRQVGNALDSLRSALRAMPEGAPMQQAQLALQVVEKTVGPTTPAAAQPAPGQVGAAATAAPDPRELYRDAVIDNVVDAMLGYSVQMSLGADEWLTVAARGNDAPLSPQGLSDTVTITVKVKGSDLTVYHADPARRSEIREKVKADAKVF